jgi:GT2 family glycosyltransferase
MIKVPVVILNYNTSLDCGNCISFLRNQINVAMEIIVVDNCSRDNDLVKLRTLCKEQDVKLIENKENRGYNAGNNVGLRYAASKGYKYALIANPDMEFPQCDYLAKLVEKMESDNEIVVCGSDILHYEGFHQNPVVEDKAWYHCFGWIYLVLTSKKHKYALYTGDYTQSCYCKKLSGCCLLLRVDFLVSIGFFDENVFLYCEEGILAKQVEMATKKCFYISEIQAFHNHIKKQKGKSDKAIKEWLHSSLYFEKKYNNKHIWNYLIVKIVFYLRYVLLLALVKINQNER